MADITVLGGAGELGSNFAKVCLDKGFSVNILDIVRFNEAWRLKWLGIADKIKYIWKSTFDLAREDIDSWLVLDAACQPDRPLGTSSPYYTTFDNLLGPTALLNCMANMNKQKKPIILYPSSSNIFLGVPPEDQPLVETSIPRTINHYGWSKLAAEELYQTHNRCRGFNSIIIRTGSCYGEGMRSDQMIARCILHMLNNRDFLVRSPEASRTYTYTGDVLTFYNKLIERLQQDSLFLKDHDNIIHNGGNAENKAYKTAEVAETIHKLTNPSNSKLITDEYEIGERLPDGRPVQQLELSERAYKLLGWKPTYTLAEGLKKTAPWFKERLGDYV